MDWKKIVIATYGTRGDIQPLLALGLMLSRHGYKVISVFIFEKGYNF